MVAALRQGFWNKKTGLLFVMGLFVLNGCAVHINKDRNIGGFSFNEVKERESGEVNIELLRAKYGPEWRQNRGDKESPPALGLAMSGGGMRSAAFNIGVLKGLYEKGVLKKVDIMSAVSGGSYAMSWYYLQQYYSGEDEAALFNAEGRFQQHLENNGSLITHSDNWLLKGPEYLIKTGANLFATPFHLFANALFNWNLNLAPNRRFYENGIERVFHLTPVKDGDGFINSSSILGVTVGVDEEVTFPKMRDFIKQKKLPSFVINTTVKISDSMDHYDSDFANTIFEFTPFRLGADSFGYSDNFPVAISRAVSISGAAADSAVMPSPIMQFFYSAANLDLGYQISNYNLTTGDVSLHNALPFPLYALFRDLNDINGANIYLSDGGHSENLGAFTLIRRLCRNIIIVDAEHDPDYQFSGYKKLKARLKSELHVDFTLPELDKNLFLFTADISGQKSLHEGTLSPPLHMAFKTNGHELSTDLDINYLPGSGEWIVHDKPGRKGYTIKKENNRLKVCKIYDGSRAVMKGEISWFPLKNQKGILERISIGVTYIKLSLDKNRLASYPESVRGYYKENSEKSGFLFFEKDPFPQQGTSDISYSKDQFSAYRDLGYYIVMNNM